MFEMRTSAARALSSNKMKPRSAESVGRQIALISMTVGVVLAVFKVLVGLKAHSAAVVSDGLEAAGDVLSSGIVYAGLWLASKPPDNEHPYGHGRYETLASLAVGGMLLLTGCEILWHNYRAFAYSEEVRAYALIPLVAAVVLKTALSATKLRTGRRIESTALQSDAFHDITDLLSTCVATIAVLLNLWNPARFRSSDRVGGMVIGAIIVFISVRVVRRTVDQLLDTMPEDSKLQQIRAVAADVPGALGIEKCFARRTGLQYYVDLHLEVDPEMTVRQSHEIATKVRGSIKDNLPWVADVLVHVEPSPLRSELYLGAIRSHGK